MGIGLRDWHRLCRSCGHESACLPVEINEPSAYDRLSEDQRELALKDLRRGNNLQLIHWIKLIRPARDQRLLDVGAGHGWFLQQALPSFSCVGLEPDKRICAAARTSGLPVVEGFFPSALGAGERFDVIVFNDVFEHLPDSRAILCSVRDHLTPNGLLVINAPNRDGAIYQIAKLLARTGARWLFERMWQLGLPSPHVQYFSRNGLARLVCSAGFAVERVERLPAVRLRGLLARVRYTKDSGVVMAAIIFAFGVLVLPVLRLLPSDAVVVFGRRLETGDMSAMPG